LAAIGEEFDLLSAAHAPGELLLSGRLNEAFARFEAKVNALRARGVLLVAPVDQALALAGSLAALQSLCDELNQLRRAMTGLPRVGQPLPLKANREVLPAPDWFWVRVAIKGGLTAVIAIICFEWLNPPGSASFPLMAWLLTIMGRPFLRARRQWGPAGVSDGPGRFTAALRLRVPAAADHAFSGQLSSHESNAVPRIVCVRVRDGAHCRH
jgi:hypothetical protein